MPEAVLHACFLITFEGFSESIFFITSRRMKNRHGCTLVIQNDGAVKGLRSNSQNQGEELSSTANKYAILEFIPT